MGILSPCVVVLAILVILVNSQSSEIKCSSFEYERQTLRTVISLEHEFMEFKKQMKLWEQLIEAKFEKYETIDQTRESRTEEMIKTFSTLQQETSQRTKDMQLQLEDSQKGIERQLEDKVSLSLSGFNSTMEAFLKEQPALATKKSQQVAFTVHTPTGTLVDGCPTFSKIMMNIGGGYDTTTGKFHSQVSGLYSFSVTLSASSSRTGAGHVYCWVRSNSTNTVFVQTYQGRYDSASVAAFIQLSVGDTVDLRCGGWNKVQTGPYTSFTGALIRAD